MQLKTMADKDNLDEVKSPIIMQVDAPPDENSENSSQEADEETVVNDSVPRNSFIPKPSRIPFLAKTSPLNVTSSNSLCAKRSILTSPKLTLNNGAFPASTSKPVLRPSKLSQANTLATENNTNNGTVKKAITLNPPQLNPFVKPTKDVEDVEKPIAENVEQTTSNITKPTESTKFTPLGGNPFAKASKDESTDSEKPKQDKSDSNPVRFVPLSGNGAASSSNSNTNASSSLNNLASKTSTPSFVFGQNLHERVVVEKSEGNGIDSIPTTSTSCSSNGTSETLFNAPVVNEIPTAPSDVKSLSEAAREYEEARAQKRKYEEVTVITGEENETNIMQITCKLFAYDQAIGNWQERGRGTLRLNDIVVDSDDKSQSYTKSRLVVRSAGSLRVVLNTKIWAEMSVELASPKSIRLTAMDSSGVIKVFLIMGNIKEIEKLYKLMRNRVELEAKRQNKDTTKDDEPSSKRKPDDSVATTSEDASV